MENFTFYSPILFAFGKERENETGGLIKRFGASHQLSQADYDMIVMPINRLAEKPSGILKAARDKCVQKNPLSMEEIDEEIQVYRKDKLQ